MSAPQLDDNAAMPPADARLEVLFRRFGPLIFHRCRCLLGNTAAAQDATQETFLRVRQHLEKVSTTEEGLAYIYRTATNYCLNERRNEGLRAVPVAALPEQTAASFEELVADRQLATKIISRIPEHLRAPAFLHYIDGLSQDEVATVLGVSRRTVVHRLTAFRERAQRFLKDGES
jgi:RNA polymerase sigma-70 factor (ECF subfamily)